VKTSLCTLHSHSLIVDARTFPCNPYDGHTLEQQLEQTGTLQQDITIAAHRRVHPLRSFMTLAN
jgi:transposase, IS5 family